MSNENKSNQNQNQNHQTGTTSVEMPIASPAVVVPVAPVQTAAQLELEQLALEEKRLAVAFQKAQLEDMRERLDERALKRVVSRSRSVTNGQTLLALARNDKATQGRCNHRKGGNGLPGYVGGQGDDTQYSVLKHKVSNSDLWIRCMRCGKTWKPVLPKNFATPEEYQIAFAEYQAAVNFPTKNITSSSVVFQFSDNGTYFRDKNKDVSMR